MYVMAAAAVAILPPQCFPICELRATLHSAYRTPTTTASASAQQSTLLRIQSRGLIACLRAPTSEVALHAARAALDGGISVLEVTMTTPGASEVITSLVREYPSATIGAGTVLTLQDAEEAKQAGATFLASPVTNKEIVQAHRGTSTLFIPSVMTPSEILQARRWGASCVKLYPASLMGGVPYVRMLKQLFPNFPIVASNGIGLDAVKQYWQVGASAVIVSDAVFNKTAISQHDYAHILRLSNTVAALSSRTDFYPDGQNKVQHKATLYGSL